MNIVILIGNVGRDPQVRTTQYGDKVASFSLATSERWKDKATGERKEHTDWHQIVCWNENIVGVIEQYVAKGSKVSVRGKLQTRKYQDTEGNDRYTTEVVIGRFDGALGLEGDAGGGGSNPREPKEPQGRDASYTRGTREGGANSNANANVERETLISYYMSAQQVDRAKAEILADAELARRPSGGGRAALDDDIPFAPEWR